MSALDALNYDETTAKRAKIEQFEFRLTAPYTIEVVNVSYGFQAADHVYSVTIGTVDGEAVPTECTCKAYKYGEGGDCKHIVFIATVGDLSLLDLAGAFSPHTIPFQDVAELEADGGTEDTCENGDPMCDGPDGDDLACWSCYRTSGDSNV